MCTASRQKMNSPRALGFLNSTLVPAPEAGRPDGKFANVVWDPNDGKFYWLNLKFVENDKPVEMKGATFGWSSALAYDPELKLVALNNDSVFKVWVMKFDRADAGL